MSDENKNRFGGGNAHSLYVPMSDDEQEVLLRLVESQTLRVHIYDWGMKDIIPTKISYGDKRISIKFRVEFTSPLVPVRVPALNLELRTADGYNLFRKPYPTAGADGMPIQICDGVQLDLIWDIAIDHMDPALVKAIKPWALGLTTRRLDKETGNRTMEGNMRVSDSDKQELQHIDRNDAYVRQLDPATIAKLEQKKQ